MIVCLRKPRILDFNLKYNVNIKRNTREKKIHSKGIYKGEGGVWGLSHLDKLAPEIRKLHANRVGGKGAEEC